MESAPKTCPRCGSALMERIEQCPRCHWVGASPTFRRGMWVFVAFTIAMLLIGAVVLQFALRWSIPKYAAWTLFGWERL